MKKTLLLLTVLIFAFSTQAATFNVTTSGNTYVPATVTASIGDTVKFTITQLHPTVQVTGATWNANGFTPIASGFGGSSNFEVVITASSPDTLYYVCANHVSSGMKGIIVVDAGSSSAINEVEVSNITIGPNPVVGNEINYSFTNQVSPSVITIYSITGQIVESVNITTTSGVIPANFAKGNYILKAYNQVGEIIATEKIIVE